ncbi:MAG: hypothetical protein ACK559_25895, partial [bacterium]
LQVGAAQRDEAVAEQVGAALRHPGGADGGPVGAQAAAVLGAHAQVDGAGRGGAQQAPLLDDEAALNQPCEGVFDQRLRLAEAAGQRGGGPGGGQGPGVDDHPHRGRPRGLDG